jgi:membrane protein required for beta-lactamase induction
MKCEEDEFLSLKTFSVARAYFYVILNPKSLWALLCYLRTVLCDFFLLQFSVKLGFRKIKKARKIKRVMKAK